MIVSLPLCFPWKNRKLFFSNHSILSLKMDTLDIFGDHINDFPEWDLQSNPISEIFETSFLSEWNRKCFNKSNLLFFSHYINKLGKNGNSITVERLCIVSYFVNGLFIGIVWKHKFWPLFFILRLSWHFICRISEMNWMSTAILF